MEHQALVTVMPWNFIFTICNLLFLTWIFKKFLFKPVQNILDKRQAEIASTYEEADKANTAAKEMEAEYTQRLSSAKAEATDIVKTATLRATVRSEEMINEAKSEVAAIKTKAEADIETERKKAAAALKDDISGIAIDIAGKVVEKEIDEQTHRALIDDFISHVGDAS